MSDRPEMRVRGLPGVLDAELRHEDPASLQRHPANPRRGRLDVIGESLEESGFYGALVAQVSTRRILVGNHRWEMATRHGVNPIPVWWVDVDDDAALRILAVDNRSSDLARDDAAVLADLLLELDSRDGLRGSGWDGDSLAGLLAGLSAPSLDELVEEFGEPDERDFWPVIRLRVFPADHDHFWQAMEACEGADDAERFGHLLDRLGP